MPMQTYSLQSKSASITLSNQFVAFCCCCWRLFFLGVELLAANKDSTCCAPRAQNAVTWEAKQIVIALNIIKFTEDDLVTFLCIIMHNVIHAISLIHFFFTLKWNVAAGAVLGSEWAWFKLLFKSKITLMACFCCWYFFTLTAKWLSITHFP